MFQIINTTELQKALCQIIKNLEKKPYVIINRGFPKGILLPYFEDAEEAIKDYFTAFQMDAKKPDINNNFEKSMASGLSRLQAENFKFTNHAKDQLQKIFDSNLQYTLGLKLKNHKPEQIKPVKNANPVTHKLEMGVHRLFLKKEDHGYTVIDVEKDENPTYN